MFLNLNHFKVVVQEDQAKFFEKNSCNTLEENVAEYAR